MRNTRETIPMEIAEAAVRELLENPPAGHPENALIAIEDQPEYIESWALGSIPDFNGWEPFSNGYVDYLERQMADLKNQLLAYHYHADLIDQSVQEQVLWTTLQDIVLMAKALQIAIV